MYTETGKLITKKIESGTSKAGKPWTKMTFVIETLDETYPKKIAFDTFKGNMIEMINDTTEGTMLRVNFAVESREWGGKYFSNVNAISAEVTREVESNNRFNEMRNIAQNNFEPQEGDLPF